VFLDVKYQIALEQDSGNSFS